jgi:hypothetical protein
MGKVIPFCRKMRPDADAWSTSWPPNPLSWIGQVVYDQPDLPPLVKLFYLLEHFDEVPLPDRRVYQLRRGRLRVKEAGQWRAAQTTVNELLALVSGLTHAQWLNIKQRSAKKCCVFDWSRQPAVGQGAQGVGLTSDNMLGTVRRSSERHGLSLIDVRLRWRRKTGRRGARRLEQIDRCRLCEACSYASLARPTAHRQPIAYAA